MHFYRGLSKMRLRSPLPDDRPSAWEMAVAGLLFVAVVAAVWLAEVCKAVSP